MATPFIDVQDEFPEVDSFYVGDKDENYYYAWVNKKPENVERRKLEGYETVAAKDGEKGENTLVRPNAAGERVMGDVVLMRMPRERHEALLRRRRQKSAAQLDTANATKAEQIRSKGMETEDTTRRIERSGTFSE